MKETYIVILITLPELDLAKSLARRLVEKKLVACAQIDSPITSIYTWNNKIEEDKEWRIVAKTKNVHFESVEKLILDIHPYDVPQIIAIPVTHGHLPYLDWIDESTSKST